MFEYIRTHQRLMQFLLLLIIFPSFAFFGIESYTRSKGAEASVATVAGQSISQQEFELAIRDQLDRFRQMYGARFDSKMLSTPEARAAILDELVARKASYAELLKAHLSVPDAVLQQNILTTPGLQKADGSFDGERYKAILASQGMTPALYEQRLRQDLVLQQLMGAVQGSTVMPRAVAEKLLAMNEQEREVQTLTFKSVDYFSKLALSDEKLQAFYDKNPKLFEVPEQVRIEYVVLSLETLSAKMTVSDEEVRTFYEQNKKLYTSEEMRRASHILIAAKTDGKDEEAKKAQASQLLEQVRKNPEVFAKLAKEHSQDPVSAERGGDLDFFGKGTMTKSFEEAAYRLKPGEISDLVRTEFGYHIIKLTDIRAASVKSLESVKAQIESELKKQKASKAYAEAAELFGNMVYEQSDSLQPVADKLQLKIEQASALPRQPGPGVTALLNQEKFLKELYTSDALKNKHNTAALELAPNTLVSARVLEYKPVAKRPFVEVKAAIAERVRQDEADALAVQEGERQLAALRKEDRTNGFSEVQTISRQKAGKIAAQDLKLIMQADGKTLPVFVGVKRPGEGYVIYRIGKIMAGEKDESSRTALRAELAAALSQEELAAYLEALKAKAKVSINKTALEQKQQQTSE